jgi:hypothetical protein
MLKTQKMEVAVNGQNFHLAQQRVSLLLGLSAGYLRANDNITEVETAVRALFFELKTQNIGGLISAAVFFVKTANGTRAHQGYHHFSLLHLVMPAQSFQKAFNFS